VAQKKTLRSSAASPGVQASTGSQAAPFDISTFLAFVGSSGRTVHFPKGAIIFAQGDRADRLYHLQHGATKLSVVSSAGKEAVVAILGPSDFFGEGCLAGQTVRMGSATAVTSVTALVITKKKMMRLLHDKQSLAEFFLTYVLSRNIRIEEDLIDQLFNSSEKRLARTLLLLARFGKEDKTDRIIPKLSQEVLAEMVGTTRSRVNFFMNKFRRLGFIEYNGVVKINHSLLSVVLHD
jgi:CRP/FNR family transcriptional regulator, cyclic AMP receptor protein